MDETKYYCEICGEIEIFPKFCCDGFECSCMGMPIEPPVCSRKCFNEYLARVKKRKGEDKQ